MMNARPSSQSGMTLVEIMVVLFIIGLTAGLVVMTLPARESPERAAAAGIYEALSTAQDQAILTGQPTGLRFDGRSYTIQGWRDGRWIPVKSGSIDGRLQVILPDDVAKPVSEGWPNIVFDPTGLSNGAAISLRGRDARVQVTVSSAWEVLLETF